MRDLGFTGRALTLRSFGAETRKVATAGVTYGLRDKVVRFIMFASLVQGVFFMYGFYSWQKYFLDLLGQNLVWVTGVIAALVGLTQILGNMLVGRIIARWPDRGLILMACAGLTTVTVIGAALIQNFWVAVPLYLVSTIAFGISLPVKQGWLNARIPSQQRATVISLDALFGDGGSTVGQVGLGWMSSAVSIPAAWLVGGVVQGIAVPLLGVARRGERERPAESLVWDEGPAPAASPAAGTLIEAESAGCFGPEPAATCVVTEDAGPGGEKRVA
jgi:MFS family permease